MDAHEVEREHQAREEGVVFPQLDLAHVLLAHPRDRVRGRRGAGGREPRHELSGGEPLGDPVVGLLPPSGEGGVLVAVEVPVELQDDPRGHGDVVVAAMDEVQHVAVAGYLAFVSVPGIRPFRDELPEAPVGGRDVLDPVRRPHALDHRHLAQRLELAGPRGLVKPLPSAVLPDVAQRGHHLGHHEAGEDPAVIELPHTATPLARIPANRHIS